ncbi:coiled-coil domain-containing protein CG32809 isoform X14 [Rhagoletis pomonella]|uniref:coiled-coil domain-containing protein CG32809 isoform X14 n=1 Tax=Rhagoletis pomonella TaxID=28610 RepID=UPI00177AD126|nr:coiled-coil domain-containing protein CG32809 isoform X14 [Rhagoletis pomonella]
MLIRWKSKDKSSSNQSSSSSSSSKKKRKGREAEDWQNESKAGRMPTNEQVSDHRRGMRRDDPRRHTLGGDMIMYAGNQGQQQQRAMDLEMSTRAQKNKKNNVPRGYTPLNQGPLFDDDPGIMSEVETASTGFRRGNKQRSSLPVVRTPSKTLERPLGLVFLQYRSETKRALLPNEITSIDTVRALFVRSFPRQLTMAYLEGPNVKIYIHDASKDMFYELEDVRSHLREIRDRSVLRLFESTEVAAPPQILPGGPGVPQPLPQVTPNHWDQDQSYFSEPEFDSDYKHQHIHKSKIGKQAAPYYVGASQTLPRGMYSSERTKVPIGAPVKPLRAHNSRGSMEPLFPYSPDQLYSIPDGYSSSPERSTRGNYEEPYYSQYGTRGPVVAPIIDEEQSEVGLAEDQYAVYGMKVGPGRMPRPNQMYDNARPEDLHRIRVEHMERQLANLTGLVQKALVNQHPQIAPIAVPTLDQNYLVVPTQCQANGSGNDLYIREKAPKLGKSSCQKSVSFEKSVSFSDDIQGIPKSHSPQHAADTKPTKPAIKSSTLPRTSSQERDRLKPPPPPKPLVLAQPHQTYRADIALAPEVYNHLRGLQKKAKDLRMEVRTLRRLSQAQAVAVREDIKGTFMRIRATLLASSGTFWGTHQGDQDATRISREEELYKQEVIRLEKDLSDLEASVETLRGEVINRRTRVNMTAVEDMALVLSRASKTVAELKMKFPALSNGLRCMLSSEMERVVREEKFLKEEPDRLESALRRCKKLTGTLVTLKRLASVQEQRLPPNEPQINEEPPRSAEISNTDKPVPTPRMGSFVISGGPENALDALLDELQTFSKPLSQNNEARPDDSTSDESSQAVQSTVTTQISQARLYIQTTDTNTIPIQSQPIPAMVTGMVNTLPHKLNHNIANTNLANPAVAASLMMHTNVGSLRRLHSYPSGSDTDMSPPQNVRASTTKPPVPERTAELITKVSNKRIPPPPPPRTSSRSPLASPTNPNVPQQLPTVCESDVLGNKSDSGGGSGSGNSSGNESANDHVQRQVALEMRHQELLKKQKLLQEQYQRLQQMTKISGVEIGAAESNAQLQKTGSESNLQQKISFSIANAGEKSEVQDNVIPAPDKNNKTMQLVNNIAGIPDVKGNSGGGGGGNEKSGNSVGGSGGATTKQLYETEIL